MHNVTNRIKEITQPKGGYIKPSMFEVISLGDGIEALHEEENVHASVIGMTVDYLTRFMMTGDKEDAFRISLWGAMCAVNEGYPSAAIYATQLFDLITGLDDASIIAALKLTTFDVWYRCPARAFQAKSAVDTNPDEKTIENVRAMVERGVVFFKKYGPVTADGFTFEPEGLGSQYENWRWNGTTDFGGYTRTVSGGDGDFLTEDTLWDFKVSKSKITSAHTLQLMMYYIMGQHSEQCIFKGIDKVGVFNPRRNEVYLLNISSIPEETIKIIEKDVLCYQNAS